MLKASGMNQNGVRAAAKPVSTNPQLLNEKQAAEILCYSVRALQNWRHRGGGPDFVKVSARSVRYRRADLDKWIAERTVSSTSQTT
jgi:predicted DNA-binding transcriptional regulator AlpA